MKAHKHESKKIDFRIPIALGIIALAVFTIILWRSNMKPVVVFETSMGNFEVEVDTEKAPISSQNFLSYVKEGYYNGLIFHRVIGDFMIQGGGFTPDMKQKDTKPPIKNEAANGLKNMKYTVAMARTSIVDSATSQFFVNVEDNSFLDHRDNTAQGYGYAVFGKVVSGTDTIEKIKAVRTGSFGPHGDVPQTPVVITRAYVK